MPTRAMKYQCCDLDYVYWRRVFDVEGCLRGEDGWVGLLRLILLLHLLMSLRHMLCRRRCHLLFFFFFFFFFFPSFLLIFSLPRLCVCRRKFEQSHKRFSH